MKRHSSQLSRVAALRNSSDDLRYRRLGNPPANLLESLLKELPHCLHQAGREEFRHSVSVSAKISTLSHFGFPNISSLFPEVLIRSNKKSTLY